MGWFRFSLLLLALLAAGCGRVTDSEQLRLCRLILPVLHAEGTEIQEIRVAPRGRSGVRIDYAARAPGAARRAHFLACGFGGATFERDRLDLVAVETDGGTVGEARLLFLKRYLAEAGHEVAPLPEALPQLPAAVAYALQQLINALALAAVYALLATAYSLIYGLVGRINLAFGEIAVLGAYGAIGGVTAAVALGIGDPIGSLALALAIAAAVAGGWSMLVGRAVVAPLHARHRLGQPILIATAAVALSISEFVRITQGSRERWSPPVFNQPIALARARGFRRHRDADADRGRAARTGRRRRGAVAARPDALRAQLARLRGRSRQPPRCSASMGGGCSPRRSCSPACWPGSPGWIVAAYYGNVSHSMGAMLGLKALVAAVVGGIGSVPGAFLGGVCVALIEALWSAYFDITARDIVVFALLIVVFVLRPGGLLGFAGPKPRDV